MRGLGGVRTYTDPKMMVLKRGGTVRKSQRAKLHKGERAVKAKKRAKSGRS